MSVSHSGEHICVAFVPTGRVGVDVQRCGIYPEKIVRRFFPTAEYEWLSSIPNSERPRAFALLWTIKEAICKASGEGLRFPLPEIDVPVKDAGRWNDLHWAIVDVGEAAAAAVAWGEDP